MSAETDKVNLIYILDCIANVEELTAAGRSAFEAAKHDRAAVLYYLQTMAESTQRLSDLLKSAHPEIDWVGINGFRNRLVHGYLSVNADIL
ncbi:MAG TPA: HepT-like ribonuclease domain-containing protein [Phototrophicaceae bacterium]|nr:HepT-like ribonuclease domain-containing protein [Phototrophicaceae bacterium]